MDAQTRHQGMLSAGMRKAPAAGERALGAPRAQEEVSVYLALGELWVGAEVPERRAVSWEAREEWSGEELAVVPGDAESVSADP